MMRLFCSLVFISTMCLGICTRADGALLNRGVDSLGNRLIYDTDLNITWYDYTNPTNGSDWYTHMAWADALSVTIGTIVYDDWRLPTIEFPDAPVYAHGFSGLTSYGYNITSSEMGHLFHTELGNIGRYDTVGNDRGPEIRLVNTGPFLHLQPVRYYDNQTYPLNVWSAGHFDFGYGEQYVTAKQALGGTGNYGIAVRPGDVIPEPATLSLLALGGLAMTRRRRA